MDVGEFVLKDPELILLVGESQFELFVGRPVH